MKNPFEGMFGGNPDEEITMEGTIQEQADQRQLAEDAKNIEVTEEADNDNNHQEAA